MNATKIFIVSALFAVSQTSHAITYKFGDAPIQYVESAANQYKGTCGLTKNELIAYFLAPTWGESADLLLNGQRWASPSPMTLGRHDTGSRLVPPEESESGAVWHPGIGAWQLDDGGIGSSAKPGQERFDSSTATTLVVGGMVDRLTTAGCKPANIFSPWSASCGAKYSTCFARHDAILKILNSGATLPTESVDRFGGGELHMCRLAGHTVSCLFVDPGNAQPKGETRNWSDPLLQTPLKLARPFYVYHLTDDVNKVTYEWRYWLAADTLNGHDIAARRADGQNSRSKICWISSAQGELGNLPNCQLPASSLGLCDLGPVGSSGPLGPQRGACSGPSTLAVNLTATPSSGPAPLNGVTLTANVTGAPNETIDYTFYCDRSDAGVNITPNWNKKYDTVSRTQVRVPSLCNYPSGTHTAKVIAEQGNGAAESRVQITVGSSISCFPLTLAVNNPSGGSVPTSSPAASSGCASGQYVAGERIDLTAVAASGWNIGNWSGTQNDTSTSETNSLVMPASSHAVTVNYVQPGAGGAPSLSGGSVDGITTNSAILHAFANPNGLQTTISFKYGTGVPPVFISTPLQNIGMGRQVVPFSANLASLSCSSTYTYYASATNSAGPALGLPQTFATSPCGSALTIVTVSLPNAFPAQPYAAQLTASGGTGGFVWSLVGGSLPTGLTLNAQTGAISGTPANGAQTGNFTISVRDSGGHTASRSLSIFLPNGMYISTAQFPKATVGSPYSTSLAVSGGIPGYTWSFIAPPGDSAIRLAASGILSGPTALANDCPGGATDGGGIWLGAGYPTSNFTVQVRDSTGQTATRQLCLVSYYPTPQLGATNPSAVIIDGQTHTVSVSGGNFRSGAVINVGASGTPVPTTYVNSSSLSFSLYPSTSGFSFGPSLGDTGPTALPISAVEPDSDIPQSIRLLIYAPAPSLSSVSAVLVNTNEPCTANASCQLVVNGSGFLSGSVTSFLIAETNTVLSEAATPSTSVPWAQITTTPFTAPAGSYTLKVTNQAQPSGQPASAIASFSVQPAAPTAVTIYAIYPQWTTGDYLGLFWTLNTDSDFLAYRVYRSSHANVTTSDTLVAEITNQTQRYYMDSSLPASNYFYNVVSVNRAGRIAYSNEVYGKIFAPSEILPRIPGVPEPGDTIFPPNVAVPDSVSVLQRFDCTHDPVNPDNCLGSYFAVSQVIDSEGHLVKRRTFSVSVANNLLGGINNLQFILHEVDICDATFTATDDSYQVSSAPNLGLSFSLLQGVPRFVEFQIATHTSSGLFLQNGVGVSNNTAGAIQSVP